MTNETYTYNFIPFDNDGVKTVMRTCCKTGKAWILKKKNVKGEYTWHDISEEK